jgi:Arc/MetJ family transcription regulator
MEDFCALRARLASSPKTHKYGFMVLWKWRMKTTIELPDELYRKAKAMAALNGRKLKDVVEESLRLLLEAPRQRGRQRSLAELMAGARGVVNSGVPDLGSNPRHLKGLGRNAGNR